MSTKQIIILLGAPGVGKGALSSLCVEKLSCKQLSTGDECRKHRSEGTQIGKEIDFAIKSGRLVSDNVIIDMVDKWLEVTIQDTSCIILDGFPRTAPQAEGLLTLLKQESYADFKLHIIQLVLEDQKIIDRLSSRIVCTNKSCQAVYSKLYERFKPRVDGVCNHCGAPLVRRDDDAPETIAERLKTYHHHVKALLDFYQGVGCKVTILNADQPAQKVFEDFLRIVDSR